MLSSQPIKSVKIVEPASLHHKKDRQVAQSLSIGGAPLKKNCKSLERMNSGLKTKVAQTF
jgi:hypothetical protein